MHLHSVWIPHHVKQVWYVESQDMFPALFSSQPFTFRYWYIWLYRYK